MFRQDDSVHPSSVVDCNETGQVVVGDGVQHCVCDTAEDCSI